MKITQILYYGGSREKVCRLGLSHLFLELLDILVSTPISILPQKQANSAGVVRERIDRAFEQTNEAISNPDDQWKKNSSGDLDWIRRLKFNCSIVSTLGVEIQVSGRSDLLARDIIHIRNALQDSRIDIGIIVVPSDAFEFFLTDRVANFTYARRYIETELREAQSYPIILIAVEHDGETDEPLPKKKTNLGK